MKYLFQLEQVVQSIFVKNEFIKYEHEINGLKKKLSQEFTDEQKSNMKKFGDDFEKYVGK